MGLHLPQFVRAAAIVPGAGSGADTINLTADITLAAKPASQQPAQQPAQPAYMQLHNCMATLTRILNFRKTPGVTHAPDRTCLRGRGSDSPDLTPAPPNLRGGYY